MVTGGLLIMTSELMQEGFNRVEPRFLPEKWEAVVFLEETKGKGHETYGKPKKILHNIGIRCY